MLEGERGDPEITDCHIVSNDLLDMDAKGLRLYPAAVDAAQPFEVVSETPPANNEEVLCARVLLVLAGEDQGGQISTMVWIVSNMTRRGPIFILLNMGIYLCSRC